MTETREYTYEDFGATFHQLGWKATAHTVPGTTIVNLYGKWWHEVVPQSVIVRKWGRSKTVHVHHAQTRIIQGINVTEICPCAWRRLNGREWKT